MSKKLWGGRFKEGLDEQAKRMSYTLQSDARLFPFDIQVNMAHAKALAKAGIFTEDELKIVIENLQAILLEGTENPSIISGDDEDIHSWVERNLTERCGDLGKRLHTGKSRNDQVITDARLFQKTALEDIMDALILLIQTLVRVAREQLGVPFPGFTHLQTAQPVLLSHHILAYVEKFTRDLERFSQTYERTDICPLGGGALAGNNYGLDREFIAKELGFREVTQNSMDAVSDRDFMLDCLGNSSIVMTHLSRFCEELVLWSSALTGFITIGDQFTTGSSIMPQKKNPDIAELIRGKAGRVLGNQVALIHTIKALPLTYNRDLQEDKDRLFDTVDTVLDCVQLFAKMMDTVTFHQDAIEGAVKKGYSLATELADYLVKKGIPFREAHELTGQIVLQAIEKKVGLEDLDLAFYQSVDPRIQADVKEALTIDAAIQAKSVIGGTATKQVETQLSRYEEMYAWLNKH